MKKTAVTLLRSFSPQHQRGNLTVVMVESLPTNLKDRFNTVTQHLKTAKQVLDFFFSDDK